MNLQGEIVSGQSIGDLRLGANIKEVILALKSNTVSFVESIFENVGGRFTSIIVTQENLLLVSDANDRIVRISCLSGYAEKYKEKFYPGMTVGEVKQLSKKTLCIHGFIVVEGDFGIVLSIPEIFEDKLYDDIDSIDQLPDEMVLEELSVQNPEWWR